MNGKDNTNPTGNQNREIVTARGKTLSIRGFRTQEQLSAYRQNAGGNDTKQGSEAEEAKMTSIYKNVVSIRANANSVIDAAGVAESKSAESVLQTSAVAIEEIDPYHNRRSKSSRRFNGEVQHG